jgi:protein-tyrosine phosphatase
MFSRILVTCVGNVCRSPMAAAVLSDRAARQGLQVTVASAGLAALVGAPVDPVALELMRERGLDIAGHRARQLTRSLVSEFELILVMEAVHRKAIETQFPTARGRVQRLGRWGGFDVPDPFRKGRTAFEQSLALIDRGADEFEKAFWSVKS